MKAAFHTLGCKVNQYETEAIKEMFRKEGFQIVDEDQAADVYVINTCTVTNLADRKSRQFIRRAHKINPEALVVVTGCYAQLNPEAVSGMEGVGVAAGINQKGEILSLVRTWMEDHQKRTSILPYRQLNQYENMGLIEAMESRSRAFIKIQEGCNRFCSYCIIPFARGTVRSRSREEILQEAEGLIRKGYPEIVLTGINTALYGAETGTLQIEELIRDLNETPGDFRIRLSSLEPTVVDASYAARLLKYDKLCHHLHLSVQSGSDTVLKRMNRNYDRQAYLAIVRTLREADPGYGISTDIIAGFPGETEEEFQDSLRMIREAGFCKVHAFRYSRRSGTKAFNMGDQIPGEVKSRRVSALIEEGQKTAEEFFRSLIGQTRRVLFEQYDEESGTVRGYADNYVMVSVPGNSGMIPKICDVRLNRLEGEGMSGEIVLP